MYKVLFLLLISIQLYGINFIDTNKFIAKIDLRNGYKNGNTIQGITFFNNQWLILQTDNNRKIILSSLNSIGEIIAQTIIDYPSHGQDLSFLRYKKQYFLVTSSKNNYGIALFDFKSNITLFKDVFISLGFNTVTASEDANYILTKNYNIISIYRTVDVLELKKPLPIYSFLIDKIQQEKSQWFQGLAMKDGFIYTISGNKKLFSKKYLIIYDSYGKIVKKRELFTGKDVAEMEGDKWELEGLCFINNKLYTTVMSGQDGKNIKRIYEILTIK